MPCYYPLQLPHLNHKVPCGRCIGCRLERSRQWAVRCVNEAALHAENCFVTLTYNDDSLTWGVNRPTLYPRDLQLFWKKLRKEVKKKYGISKLLYFACGEYGSVTYRPHYHACIFGLDFPDKILHSAKGDYHTYTSKLLDSVWSHGNCLIGSVTFESAAYVARYIVEKKLGNTAKYYVEESIEPEFVRMSRRPGIGSSHFEKFKSDIYPHDSCSINGCNSKPPRYYDKLLKSVNPIMYESVRSNRLSKLYNSDIFERLPKRLSIKERVTLRRLESRSII